MDGAVPRKKAAADIKSWRPQTRAVRGGLTRSNFDEIQPQSNANASPFSTPRNPNAGGAQRGFGAHNAPRHRSGPRAKAAGFGGGQKGPGGFVHRHARRPEKPRAEVNGNVALPGEPLPPSDDED